MSCQNTYRSRKLGEIVQMNPCVGSTLRVHLPCLALNRVCFNSCKPDTSRRRVSVQSPDLKAPASEPAPCVRLFVCFRRFPVIETSLNLTRSIPISPRGSSVPLLIALFITLLQPEKVNEFFFFFFFLFSVIFKLKCNIIIKAEQRDGYSASDSIIKRKKKFPLQCSTFAVSL